MKMDWIYSKPRGTQETLDIMGTNIWVLVENGDILGQCTAVRGGDFFDSNKNQIKFLFKQYNNKIMTTSNTH